MNNTEIIWRPVLGFEGYYEISNTGIVRSVNRIVSGKNGSVRHIPGVIMTQQTNHKGYKCVILHKYGEHYTKFIHRLVAEAFIDNPFKLPQVNHIDTDKTNNHVENLEWITNEDNQKHAVANGCYKGFTEKQLIATLINQKKAAKQRQKPVAQYDLDGNYIQSFESISDAERKTGCNNSKICACCKGNRKQAYGYIWKYKGDVINE